MRSIRRSLLLMLGLGLLALLGAAAYTIPLLVRGALEEGVDTALEARARALAARLEVELVPEHRLQITRLGAALTGRLAAPGAPAGAREAARAELARLAAEGLRVRFRGGGLGGEEDVSWRVVGADGATLAERGAHADAIPPTAAAAWTDPDGHPARSVGLPVPRVPFASATWDRAWTDLLGDAPQHGATVYVARDVQALEASVASLRRTLLLAGLALVLLALLLVGLATARALAPLERLRTAVRGLEPRALESGLPRGDMPVELEPIVAALDEALGRLGRAFVRERKLTADLAHELRTPIAELQAITDVARRWPEDEEIQERCVAHGHAIAAHMGRVVNALLRVARASSGEEALATEPLPLRRVVAQAWARLDVSSRERAQRLENRTPDDLTVHTDAEVLDAIVTNLLQNAVEHAPRGSTIETSVRTTDDGCALVIGNPGGPGAAGDGAGAGLGLPLVVELSEALGLGFRARPEAERFEAVLAFPARPEAPAGFRP